MKCHYCGEELLKDAIFCMSCGKKAGTRPSPPHTDPDIGSDPDDAASLSKDNTGPNGDTYEALSHGMNTETDNSSFFSKLKNKITIVWSELAGFYKGIIIVMTIAVIILLAAILSGHVIPAVFAGLQIIALIAAILMDRGVIQTCSSVLKYLVLILVAIVTLLTIKSFSFGNTAPKQDSSIASVNTENDMQEISPTSALFLTDGSTSDEEDGLAEPIGQNEQNNTESQASEGTDGTANASDALAETDDSPEKLPDPTATPKPTVTQKPTATQEPVATQEPTATQVPAATQEPTATIE